MNASRPVPAVAAVAVVPVAPGAAPPCAPTSRSGTVTAATRPSPTDAAHLAICIFTPRKGSSKQKGSRPRAARSPPARPAGAGRRSLEDLTELEVQFPPGCRAAERVDLVEAVRIVEAQGAERRDDGDADARAAEQARGVEGLGRRIHVAGVEEQVRVDGAVPAHTQLGRRRHEGVAERGLARVELTRASQ